MAKVELEAGAFESISAVLTQSGQVKYSYSCYYLVPDSGGNFARAIPVGVLGEKLLSSPLCLAPISSFAAPSGWWLKLAYVKKIAWM